MNNIKPTVSKTARRYEILLDIDVQKSEILKSATGSVTAAVSLSKSEKAAIYKTGDNIT